MEDELNETIDIVRRSAGKFDADVPVEDDAGRLIGIVSHRDLIELLVLGKSGSAAAMVVRDIMKTDLVTVSPETPTLDALELMRERSIGCLPVIRDERLVGLVTAYDFLTVSSKLLEERLSGMAVAKGAAE